MKGLSAALLLALTLSFSSNAQIITGSIGFDDWEWGVDLFADDPLVFKKLIYEMRFDEVSAVYALFGTFYIGLRCPATRLHDLMEGNLPEHHP